VNRTHHGKVLETHLRGPVRPDLDSATRSRQAQLHTRDGPFGTKSNARGKKAATVEPNVLWPRTFKPAAVATSCCSEMNISK
jgi:hypothetical protein